MGTQVKAVDYLRMEESVDACLEALTKTLVSIPSQVIECSSIFTGASAVAMLDRDAFIKACENLKPAVVFIYRESSLVDEQITDLVTELAESSSQRITLEQDFRIQEAELMLNVTTSCSAHSNLMCFFTSGPLVVAMAYCVGDYLDFTDALGRFEQSVDDARALESSLDQEILHSALKKIAETVAKDQGFISLRGKRKRAMYVLKTYRSAIPESCYVERPDQESDPIDRNVVLVARQAADIVEFGV